MEAKKQIMVLTGSITYTVETARNEAFDGIEYQISMEPYKKYFKDPNYGKNKKAMANGQEDLSDRWIGYFSNGTYNIVYKNDRYTEYTYDSTGKLELIYIRTSFNFPAKSYTYDLAGKLNGVSFYTRVNDKVHIFTYNADGSFDSHYINGKFYDKDGKLILERVQ